VAQPTDTSRQSAGKKWHFMASLQRSTRGTRVVEGYIKSEAPEKNEPPRTDSATSVPALLQVSPALPASHGHSGRLALQMCALAAFCLAQSAARACELQSFSMVKARLSIRRTLQCLHRRSTVRRGGGAAAPRPPRRTWSVDRASGPMRSGSASPRR